MNQRTMKGPGGPIDEFHTHPAWVEQTRNMVASYGLTPGLPYPFRYLERAQHPTYTTPEYVNIWPQQAAGIRQGGYRDPIIGEYRAAVEDVPFDPVHYERQQQHLAIYGLASILLGVLFT